MKKTLAMPAVLAATFLGALVAPRAASARDGCGWRDRRPYGDYCDGWRRGYGAKDPVRSAAEARERLERFFADEDVTVGEITAHDTYYEAEIHDAEGHLVDRVIIDKRTGRIRSIL